MIYLACPYSHKDPEMRRRRFEAITKIAAKLIRDNHVVFCPITHSHPLETIGGLEGSWEFWQTQDIPFLEVCDELWVVCWPGWEKSTGVQGEYAWWMRHKLADPTFYEPTEEEMP